MCLSFCFLEGESRLFVRNERRRKEKVQNKRPREEEVLGLTLYNLSIGELTFPVFLYSPSPTYDGERAPNAQLVSTERYSAL